MRRKTVSDSTAKPNKGSLELTEELIRARADIRCPKCGSKKVEQEYVAFFAVTSKKS